MSRQHGGERYVKSFDGYKHLVTMLYAAIERFDSQREIEVFMTAEVRNLTHIGIGKIPKCSVLSNANADPRRGFLNRYTVIFMGGTRTDLYLTAGRVSAGIGSGDSELLIPPPSRSS